MPTTTKRAAPDACSLLDADHRKVKKMFVDYDTLAKSKAAGAAQKRRELAARKEELMDELTGTTV